MSKTQPTAKYASLPWRIAELESGRMVVHQGKLQEVQVNLLHKENMQFIVKCVNSHDKLVETLKDLLGCYSNEPLPSAFIDHRFDKAKKVLNSLLDS